LHTSGQNNNILAFKNPDGSIVLVIQNENATDKKVNIEVGSMSISPLLKGDSFNTFYLK
jgi:glucosylceramidase